MADNFNATAGDGSVVGAADDIGGVKYPRVKNTWGPDGTANDTDIASGKPMPVQVRSATGLIPIGEPTDAKNSATDGTSVSAISVLKQVSASVQTLVTDVNPNGQATMANSAPVVIASNQSAVSVTGTITAVTAITNALPAGTNVIGHVITDTNSTTAVTGLVTVDGGTASGSSVANPPVTTGGRAATTIPTAVADGQVVNTMHDKFGRLVVCDNPRELRHSQKTTISASTSETTIITATASTFHDLYGLILANTGATTTKVDIRDTTGGSIIATIEVPTLETRGFMLPASSGIPQTTVNTNWTAQCAASTTAMEVTALYVDNK